MNDQPTGRKDWDYVEFADYEADMRESSEQAVAVITAMKAKTMQLERALMCAILAAGGEIKIYESDLHDLRPIELTTWRNDEDCTLRFTAKRA